LSRNQLHLLIRRISEYYETTDEVTVPPREPHTLTPYGIPIWHIITNYWVVGSRQSL